MDDVVISHSDVYQSWQNHLFSFKLDDAETKALGLRKPQLAALYAMLGHLLVDPAAVATVVMPTGTGKTDTMLALIIAARMRRTLILVPSDALRAQLVGKCAELTTLRAVGVVSNVAHNPIVTTIDSKLSEAQVAELAAANIIVATPQALQLFDDAALGALVDLCSHLMIDEAHHVVAVSWSRIKAAFRGKPCMQFTATPFREDGLALGGRIVYNYPLRDAQIDGYFKDIEFHPVREYNLNLSDQAIADKAVELLRADLTAGYNHLMMVRAKSHKRAAGLFKIYKEHADLMPVLIHSKVPDRAKVLADIVNKKHRIIVCVDMLGEGFDLPELKIAAIHDQHQSPAVTLQFIGRLTRVDAALGDAKFVANIANQRTDHQMAALYKESADWGTVIRDVSEQKVTREVEKAEFSDQFADGDDAHLIFGLNPNPKISAVAYHVLPKDWTPQRAQGLDGRRELLRHFSINDEANTVIAITRRETLVGWAQTEEIIDTSWDLYLAFYDEAQNTLFIHSSGDDAQATRFLNLVARTSRRIVGEPAFRALHDIKLMRLQNVGLTRARKDLRFTMHVGRDINQVISDIEKGNATKSNIFATGFDGGMRATVGCSHKGKIWEMNSSPINYWVEWCKRMSIKLNDNTIDPSDVLKDVMRVEKISKSWPGGLFYADWPESIAIENEQRISLLFQGETYNLLDVELGKPDYRDAQTLVIPLWIAGDDGEDRVLTSIAINLLEDGYKTSCPGVKLLYPQEMALDAYLDAEPLVLLKVDGSMVQGNYRHYSLSGMDVKLPAGLLEPWDWGDTKIHQESMRAERRLDSVQGFTFSKIADDYSIIFNDDGKGEIADLVAIRESRGAIHVDLYHCKFCPMTNDVAAPGARVADVYEVCGQASRSVKWLHTGDKFFNRLMDRYQQSLLKEFNRILQGTPQQIEILRNKCHDHELIFKFVIVQPAISAEKVSMDQLAVLGTSYSYIKSISGSDIKVIVSP
ncbi:DEAD/DEAH box helicase [Xanthomonas campestris]|jgi:superfamily II DNA or RNA helicase|uniref:DEAD/DEAH box helicase n=1 Tax=Xanthomonas campestris TaxID=339 RepID=UPI000E326633|nr:DEAD/DEAH box helicase family protein [Xanthomonas campestris]MEA9491780.1 DEAD/DEAH box helicase family protein [Xanthomonas campestris]MEA9510402.1 DEAD/DEAH box helicase family protein [Xanthomonas campestris]MEA9577327.1 DEAD/DEAH box helicase family protein [Xanthomonas campestris]RFF66783.1 restriction endonuclease subunit R [Xanthomonas campestris pv. campestris]